MPDDPNPLQPGEGHPIKDVLVDVPVWRLDRVGFGACHNMDGEPGSVPGMHLHLVGDTDPDGPQPPPVSDVVIRFEFDDMVNLCAELGSALTPEVRRVVAEAWLSLP
jgi:hypothetical protein